eukprot:scaffold34646_cov173-Amphora_coffeaeformis.AAC.23
MYRRTLLTAAAAASKRTIVRDPRKAASAITKAPGEEASSLQEQPPTPPPVQHQPPPFAPSQANQESIGSSLASYALAGVGVTLGVADGLPVVRILFDLRTWQESDTHRKCRGHHRTSKSKVWNGSGRGMHHGVDAQ